MELKELGIYRLAREISREAWTIHGKLSWQNKKIIGDQFIRAVDSVGANIAEGWGRFHFLDRNRFHYNARGSLIESQHWLELLIEKEIITAEEGASLVKHIQTLHVQLNSFINFIKKQASNS